MHDCKAAGYLHPYPQHIVATYGYTQTCYVWKAMQSWSTINTPSERNPLHQTKILNKDMGIQIE